MDLKGSPALDEETLDALADETANTILRESARLPEREKRNVLGIAQQFGEGFIHSRPRGKCLQHSFLALLVALQAPRAARWGYSCW